MGRRRRSIAAAGALAALAATVSLGAAPAAAQQQPQRTEIQFWHGLSQPLGGMLEQRAADFNASQDRYRVNATFRGSYPETMVAAIAGFRASTAPHIVQMFEVGTGTMMAAGRAVKPLYELQAETGVDMGVDDYLPAIRGYYSLTDGRLVSLPFNSSTMIGYYNRDAFRRAGLPDRFPATWPELAEAARALKAAGVACPYTTSWPSWGHLEQLSAIHDVPIATLGNGFGGANAELRIDNPLVVRHLTNLAEWQREGLFRYGGRDTAAEGLFPSGECAMATMSSGTRARVTREARFDWGVGFMPYYPDVQGAPINSIIGGASLWVMNRGPNATRSPEEFRGVAEFFRYLSRPDVAARWHQDTGYVPVSRSVMEATRATGFYERNPGADLPAQQLMRGGGNTTENSRGIRLGGFVEIRTIFQEEMERALQGQQTAQQAVSNAQTRGNVVLRNFERASGGASRG